MNIKDYLKYYIGQRYQGYKGVGDIHHCTLSNLHDMINTGEHVKPILRGIASLTEAELIEMHLATAPPDMEDKPTADDYSMEMFYNDGGLMVDADVAVGANYSCRCYEGQVAIRYTGDIDFYDEAGEREKSINIPKAFHYLLSLGIDLFGLIDAGLAIDAATINQPDEPKGDMPGWEHNKFDNDQTGD